MQKTERSCAANTVRPEMGRRRERGKTDGFRLQDDREGNNVAMPDARMPIVWGLPVRVCEQTQAHD